MTEFTDLPVDSLTADGDQVLVRKNAGTYQRVATETLAQYMSRIPNFSASRAYKKDTPVINSGVLYRAKSDLSAGAFNIANWEAIATSDGGVGGSTGIADWAPSPASWLSGALVVTPTGALVQRTADGDSVGASFDATEAANWTLIDAAFKSSTYANSTYYFIGQVVDQGNITMRKTAASGDSEASLNATEIARWELITQRSYVPWAGTTAYVAGEMVVQNDEIIERLTAGVSTAAFVDDAANWGLIGPNSTKLLDERFDQVDQPSSGTGTVQRFASIWGDGHSYLVLDNDAGVASAWTLGLTGLSLTAGDTYQVQLDIGLDELNANHVIEVAIGDGVTGGDTLLIDIGSSGLGSLVQSTPLGTINVDYVGTVIDRGITRMLRMDFVLSVTGLVTALSMGLAFKPLYNLDGTVTENASLSGSGIVLHALQMGAPSEFNLDKASSGYVDVGSMRMAWGVTAGGSATEAVVFPGGGFAAAPSITITPADATVREVAVDNVTASGADLEAGGTGPKHWQAMGLKP